MYKENRASTNLKIGDRVYVRRSHSSPCAGSSGTVIAIDPKDRCGPYLVRLDNALQFRYSIRELEHIRTADMLTQKRSAS